MNHIIYLITGQPERPTVSSRSAVNHVFAPKH
jgi:hypothetical protein